MHRFRRVSTVVLGGLLAAASADGQAPPPPAGIQPVKAVEPPPAGKDAAPKNDMTKEKEKEKEKPKPAEWPKEVGGKNVAGYVKDLNDHDPHIRVTALQALPLFGPDAQKVASKALLKVIALESRGSGDTAVMTAAINAIAALGLDEPDIKDGCRVLGEMIATSPSGGLYRLYAIPALASFGRKAENAVTVLTSSNVVGDRSYEIRRAAVSALGVVSQDEQKGPNSRALEVLCGLTGSWGIKDVSAAVRMEAFQSLVTLGPPVKAAPPLPPPGSATPATKTPPPINKELMLRFIKPIKDHLPLEKDKQVEVWCRLAIMRFDPDKELNKDNLRALAGLIAKGDTAAKIHALNAIGLLGKRAAKELDALLDELKNENPLVVEAALKAVLSMGDRAKPAIGRIKEELEKRPEEYFKMILPEIIKFIEASVPSDSESDTPMPPKTPGSPMPPPKK